MVIELIKFIEFIKGNGDGSNWCFGELAVKKNIE
jgi:hypothetical protein